MPRSNERGSIVVIRLRPVPAKARLVALAELLFAVDLAIGETVVCGFSYLPHGTHDGKHRQPKSSDCSQTFIENVCERGLDFRGLYFEGDVSAARRRDSAVSRCSSVLTLIPNLAAVRFFARVAGVDVRPAAARDSALRS